MILLSSNVPAHLRSLDVTPLYEWQCHWVCEVTRLVCLFVHTVIQLFSLNLFQSFLIINCRNIPRKHPIKAKLIRVRELSERTSWVYLFQSLRESQKFISGMWNLKKNSHWNVMVISYMRARIYGNKPLFWEKWDIFVSGSYQLIKMQRYFGVEGNGYTFFSGGKRVHI